MNPLGDDLLPLLVLALGAAMVVGSGMALLKPPARKTDDADLAEAPVARSVVMILVGGVASVWAVASLVAG